MKTYPPKRKDPKGNMAIITLLITFNSRPAPLGNGNTYFVGRVLKCRAKPPLIEVLKLRYEILPCEPSST